MERWQEPCFSCASLLCFSPQKTTTGGQVQFDFSATAHDNSAINLKTFACNVNRSCLTMHQGKGDITARYNNSNLRNI